MALKEYEVNGPSGKYTVQLSEDDAKERGLKGGSQVPDAEEFAAATGAPTPPKPIAAPETPTDIAADEVSATNVQKTPAAKAK
ncbi:hypothetical protein [Mycobacterium sp. NPDC050041]|uniref:hypothetical protein n=1 Tax=Mycobacterium sp. NPDC050041 TaxID=3364293 RepID=UPI003C2B1468